MGCGASTNVKERLDYITQLEAEVGDLKSQRGPYTAEPTWTWATTSESSGWLGWLANRLGGRFTGHPAYVIRHATEGRPAR